MNRRGLIAGTVGTLACSALGGGSAHAAGATTPADLDQLRGQVADAERAFARTMSDRDLAAFRRFLADDAVFFTADDRALRGPEAIVQEWQPLYAGPEPPFSWEPEIVEVVGRGDLALSSGPVHAPDGRVVARFQSVWRREADGRWRVAFDRGAPVCKPCEPAAPRHSAAGS